MEILGRGVLFDDRRRAGSHGRALRNDAPSLRLLAGNRMEPSECVPNAGLFEGIASFPHPVTLWRPSAETLARHRNPLWLDE